MEIIIQSIVTSIVASTIFLFLLFFLRPKVTISEKIAKREGKYQIKVVNNSFWKLIDVHVELVKMIPTNTAGGKNLRIQKIQLKNNKIWYIAGKPWNEKKSHYGSHAVLFSVVDSDAINLLKNWNGENGEYLHFKVIAKHGLSSFAKISTCKYHNAESDIKEGRFSFGNCTEIV